MSVGPRWVGGSALFLIGVLSGALVSSAMDAGGTPLSTTVLENSRVQVEEVTYAGGAVRPAHTRTHDQAIVFVSDASYEVVYPDGRKVARSRRAGETIWQSPGGAAPTLTNSGGHAYRTIVVSLK